MSGNVAKIVQYIAAACDAGSIFFVFFWTCRYCISWVRAFLVSWDVGFFDPGEDVDAFDFVGFESLKQAAEFVFSRF